MKIGGSSGSSGYARRYTSRTSIVEQKLEQKRERRHDGDSGRNRATDEGAEDSAGGE